MLSANDGEGNCGKYSKKGRLIMTNVNMRGSKGREKGFYFQTRLTEAIMSLPNIFPGFYSYELDKNVFCESIGKMSRDKIDNIIVDDLGVKLKVSAKCPGSLDSIQMAAFAMERQLRFLESATGRPVPKVFKDYCYAFFGHAVYEEWMKANDACGVDASKLSKGDGSKDDKSETRRQRTLLSNIADSVQQEVKSYLDLPDVRRAFVEMQLISGFTGRRADCQIWHPAPTKGNIDFDSNNFYYVDQNAMYEECQKWEWELGESTINFGPLNWKVRGGGGPKCTPTHDGYHGAQCFSGISKLQEHLGDTDAFLKGSFPEVVKYAFERKK